MKEIGLHMKLTSYGKICVVQQNDLEAKKSLKAVLRHRYGYWVGKKGRCGILQFHTS